MLQARSLYENLPWKHFTRAALDARFAGNAFDLFAKTKRIITHDMLSEFDSVVFYAYWLHTPATVGALMRRHLMADPKRGVVVSRAHAYDVDDVDNRFGYLPARRFLLDELDEIYPISVYAESFLRKHGERRPGQFQIRRLGVPEVAPITRHRSERISILSCSHMAPYKRIDLMIQAIGELERRGIDVSWTHIGESDPDLRAAAQDLVAKTCPGSQVNLLGHLPNEETRRVYADPSFTVFLNTSDGEGVPVSVMDAQAAGLPVVATNAGGTAEIVHDGRNGAIVPVETTPAEIADAIERVAHADEEQYQALSRAARRTWEEMSNAKSVYTDFAKHLGELSRKASHQANHR